MITFRKTFVTILLIYNVIASPLIIERQVTPVLLGIGASSLGGALGATVMGGIVRKVFELFHSFHDKKHDPEIKAKEEAYTAQIQKAFDDYKAQQDDREKDRIVNQLATAAQKARTVDTNDRESMASLTQGLKKVFEYHIEEEQAKDAKDKADLEKEMKTGFGKLEEDRLKDKMDAKDERIKQLEALAAQDHIDDNNAANLREMHRLEDQIAELKAELRKPPRRMVRSVR